MAGRDEILNDPEVGMRVALDGRQATIWTAMPGQVTAVDLAKMTCEVQPTIQGKQQLDDGTSQYINMPLLLDVPIVFPMAGGFAFTLPLAVGDEVLVVFASRCIDAWWQSSGIQKPMEARMHDLSDGFCIPGVKSQPNVLANISTTGAQLRNEDGDQYIELAADGKIKLVPKTTLEITGAVNFTGNVGITGNLDVSGTITGGPLNTSLTTHTHPGVTAGGASTGAPNP